MYPPDASSSHWWCINWLWTKLKICSSAHWMLYWCCWVYSFESLKIHHLEGCKVDNPSSNPRLMAEWYRVYMGPWYLKKRLGFKPTDMYVGENPASTLSLSLTWRLPTACQVGSVVVVLPKKKQNPSFKIQALKVGNRSDVYAGFTKSLVDWLSAVTSIMNHLVQYVSPTKTPKFEASLVMVFFGYFLGRVNFLHQVTVFSRHLLQTKHFSIFLNKSFFFSRN